MNADVPGGEAHRGDSPRFIFLLCSERSGSNLVTRMFGAHPEVCGPSPTHIGSDVLCNLHRYGDLDAGGADALVEDTLDLFEAKMGEWTTRPTRESLDEALREGGVLAMYRRIYTEEARAGGNPWLFVKENRLYEFAILLTPMLPDSRFLYAHRDPRDMAASWKQAPSLRGGVVRAAGIWAADQAGFLSLRAQLEAVTGRPVPRLAYESLLADPERQLARVTGALGLRYAPEMLDFHDGAASRAQADAAPEWNNISEPLMRGNAGRYRETLSPDEVRYVESVCRDGMAALGYATEESPLEEADLQRLHDRLAPLEPVDKPAYQALPRETRDRRRRQHAVLTRIRTRPYRAGD